MNNFDFGKWLEKKFLEWQTANGRRHTLADFADYLAINPSLLSRYMSGKITPGDENIKPIAARLGPETYDVLGLARPDPILQYVTRHWHELPEEKQNQIREQVENYLVSRDPSPETP